MSGGLINNKYIKQIYVLVLQYLYNVAFQEWQQCVGLFSGHRLYDYFFSICTSYIFTHECIVLTVIDEDMLKMLVECWTCNWERVSSMLTWFCA